MGKGIVTQKQQALLEFLHRYLREHPHGPFIWEIQAGCQIVSYKSAVDRLNALERKGIIKRIPNKHRGIKLDKRMLTEPQPQLQASQATATVGEVT